MVPSEPWVTFPEWKCSTFGINNVDASEPETATNTTREMAPGNNSSNVHMGAGYQLGSALFWNMVCDSPVTQITFIPPHN